MTVIFHTWGDAATEEKNPLVTEMANVTGSGLETREKRVNEAPDRRVAVPAPGVGVWAADGLGQY